MFPAVPPGINAHDCLTAFLNPVSVDLCLCLAFLTNLGSISLFYKSFFFKSGSRMHTLKYSTALLALLVYMVHEPWLKVASHSSWVEVQPFALILKCYY